MLILELSFSTFGSRSEKKLNSTQRNKLLFPNLSTLMNGTPTKRQVSKRQVSKRLASKRPGFQNVRFTKRQVYKTSGFKTYGFQTSSF